MPRILGVDIPPNKRIEISLRYIYGLGPTNSRQILAAARIDPSIRAKDLSDEQIARVTQVVQKSGYLVEGDLRRELGMNIKRLMSINCYRGLRHKKGLPVRGQRTHTNARTRKGPRKTVGVIRREGAKKGVV